MLSSVISGQGAVYFVYVETVHAGLIMIPFMGSAWNANQHSLTRRGGGCCRAVTHVPRVVGKNISHEPVYQLRQRGYHSMVLLFPKD